MHCVNQAAGGEALLHFMVNPASHSGRGMHLWKQIEQILLEKGTAYEVHFSQKAGDMGEIARKLTENLTEGQECSLVVLGGDGTVNEALQGICNFERVRFSSIPTGSGNDLARDMGIEKNVQKAIASLLEKGKERPMDVGYVSWEENGKIKERRFIVSCGIGYDAAVCEEVQNSSMKGILNKIGLGKITYLGIGVKNMLTSRYTKTTLLMDGSRKRVLDRMLFVAMMSHRFEGGGFNFCPQADHQDGKLDLCVVDGLPHWKFPIVIPFALKGQHYRFNGVSSEIASRIEIETSYPLCLHTDGEVWGNHQKITVWVEKQQLRFIC